MKIKTITIEIPEGKRAEWVDNVLTLVDEQPVEFKFNVGDKVAITHGEYKCYTIYLCGADNGKAYYWLKDENEVPHPKYPEDMLELYVEQPKDITERIKTFEDAKLWCTENGHFNLVREFDCIVTDTLILDEPTKDLIAYLKLRIITCALNEGWVPTFERGEERYEPYWEADGELSIFNSASNERNYPMRLSFKTEICRYAATQFKDIYMDFCYKGKE